MLKVCTHSTDIFRSSLLSPALLCRWMHLVLYSVSPRISNMVVNITLHSDRMLPLTIFLSQNLCIKQYRNYHSHTLAHTHSYTHTHTHTFSSTRTAKADTNNLQNTYLTIWLFFGFKQTLSFSQSPSMHSQSMGHRASVDNSSWKSTTITDHHNDNYNNNNITYMPASQKRNLTKERERTHTNIVYWFAFSIQLGSVRGHLHAPISITLSLRSAIVRYPIISLLSVLHGRPHYNTLFRTYNFYKTVQIEDAQLLCAISCINIFTFIIVPVQCRWRSGESHQSAEPRQCIVSGSRLCGSRPQQRECPRYFLDYVQCTQHTIQTEWLTDWMDRRTDGPMNNRPNEWMDY